MATLLYRGRNASERADVVTPSGLHLRLRAGDIVELPDDDAAWLMAERPYRYWFRPTDEPARRAVDSGDVAHDASAAP